VIVIVYAPSPVYRGHTLAAPAGTVPKSCVAPPGPVTDAARRCGKMGPMSLRVTTWFYRKLGSLYPAAFLTVELQSALVVTAATVGLFTFYYDADGDQFLHALLTHHRR
jgi:hypothetical protein